MAEPIHGAGGETAGQVGSDYPLKATAAALNDNLGLYLSEEQQRGLATGLLLGVVFGSALLAWNIAAALRRD